MLRTLRTCHRAADSRRVQDAAEAALRAENREEEEELLQALLGLDCTLAAVEGELDSLEAQRAHRRPPTTT